MGFAALTFASIKLSFNSILKSCSRSTSGSEASSSSKRAPIVWSWRCRSTPSRRRRTRRICSPTTTPSSSRLISTPSTRSCCRRSPIVQSRPTSRRCSTPASSWQLTSFPTFRRASSVTPRKSVTRTSFTPAYKIVV